MKNEKREKIKKQFLKVVHVIGYISIGLLTLIMVLSGVQSCNNNEQHAPNKNNNDIQYVLPSNNDDDLYTWGELIDNEEMRYYRYEINGDNNGYVNYIDLNNMLDIIYTFVKNGEDLYNGDINRHLGLTVFYGGSSDTAYSLYRVNRVRLEGNSYIYTNIYNEETIINKYTSNIPVNVVRFMVVNSRFAKTFEGCFKYCVGIEQGDNYARSIKYYVNPYFSIKKNTQSFYYNIAFKYQERYYYAIEYNKGEYLKFYAQPSAVVGNNGQDLTLRVQLSYSGDVYFYRFGSIGLTNDITSKTFEFIAFGKKGKSFLDEYFISQNNPRVSSTNAIDVYYMIYYAGLQNQSDTWIRKTYSVTFSSANIYYTGVIFEYLHATDNTIGVKLTYRRADMNNLIVYEGYYPNYDITEPFDYSRIQALVNETYSHVVKFDNALYTSDMVFVLSWLFSPYGVIEPPQIDNGDAFVGAFDLIGNAFTSIEGIFNIYIFPNITLGTLMIIPFVITILLFIIWLFKR